jgi:predicted ribosomally synthesized peptide with nif11-like leader
MSQEQLKGFLEAVQADVCLQEKLQAISSANDEDQLTVDAAIIGVAKEVGFHINIEDLDSLRTELERLESNDGELTEEQLEAVAGGAAFKGVTAAAIMFAWADGMSGGDSSLMARFWGLLRRRR